MAALPGGTLAAFNITKSHDSARVLDDVSLTVRPRARGAFGAETLLDGFLEAVAPTRTVEMSAFRRRQAW